MQLRAVGLDHPDAAVLIEAVQAEYVRRYGGQDDTPTDPTEFAPPHGEFLVGYLDGVPVASGGWRSLSEPLVAAEIKRMYVVPHARGRGLARAMIAALERSAARAGQRRIVLETGLAQPEAIALYASAGYDRIPGYGRYRDEPDSVYYGKSLTTASDHPAPPASGQPADRVTGRDYSPVV